jgi:hypothetical protein
MCRVMLGINQRTSILDRSLLFIEFFLEQLIDSLHMRESSIDEDVASGTRIFQVHSRLSRVHDPWWVMCHR